MSQVGPVGVVVALVFGAFVFKSCSDVEASRSPASAAAPVAIRDPAILKQQAEAAEIERYRAMTPAQRLDFLRGKLLAVCEKHRGALNYVKVQKVGNGLYCVHPMLSYYTLTIGSLGPAVGAFGEEWSAELQALGVKRVGVKAPDNEGGTFSLR